MLLTQLPPHRPRIWAHVVGTGEERLGMRGRGWGENEATRDSAVRAVFQAQPYGMLSLTTYDQWKEIDINFDPREVFGG